MCGKAWRQHWLHKTNHPGNTNAEVRMMREDEKNRPNWEASDPKPPVIQSGHLDNRK